MNRILVIGLDGYDPELGQRWMQEGALPALAQLANTSAQIELDHGDAKRTGLAWEHFSSGLTPEAANRFSAVHFDAANYRCIQKGTSATPFMRPFADDCVVFDAPYLDLTRTRGTRGVVAWGAHDPGVPEHSFPSSLCREIKGRFGPYPAPHWIYGHTWPSVSDTQAMGRDLVAATELRARISNWLFRERCPDWRLAITVVSELHSAAEALWHGVDPEHPLASQPSQDAAAQALKDVYQAVDRFIADVVAANPDATVVACSIHGMGSNHSDLTSMALLSELLYRRQFGRPMLCTPEVDGPVVPPEGEAWTDSIRRYLDDATEEAPIPPHAVAEVPRHTVLDKLTQTGRTWAKKLLMPIRHQRVNATLDWMPANWYAPDWPNMDVFALPSFYDGQVRINLQGRERKGRIAVKDYEQCIEDLHQLLGTCRHIETGEPIVAEYVTSTRSDPTTLGPSEADLIIVWNGAVPGFTHPELGTFGPLPYRRPGGHTGGAGIAWLRGPELQAGHYGTRSAFDLVPTIIEGLGQSDRSKVSGQSFWPLITGQASA